MPILSGSGNRAPAAHASIGWPYRPCGHLFCDLSVRPATARIARAQRRGLLHRRRPCHPGTVKHRRRRRVQVPRSGFAGFRFPPEVILLAVRWYLRYNLSYRDLEEILAERGIGVDHVTLYRWVPASPRS